MYEMLLAFSILLAVFSSDYLIKGSIALGQRFNIPAYIIGAVVIGFGSSLPEFSVNISAALKQETGLAIGNILGSNLFNLCISLGLISLISPIAIAKDSKVKDVPMHLIAVIAIAVCGNQLYLDGIQFHQLMPSHGIILLCFFAIYMYYTLFEVFNKSPHKQQLHHKHHKAIETPESLSLFKIIIFIVLGLIGLVVGGELIVESAKNIALDMGLSDKTVGLLIIGPGTSLPELIACISALRKKNTDMIIGNIIGSNMFNVFLTLGLTAIISPIPFDLALNKVVLFYLILSLVLCCVFWFNKRNKLNRYWSALLFLSYGYYLYLCL
ncbi:calcium/sodium antiporter [Thalassotalea agarivorans]|uniref:Cation:H+ antiporter n=1 Tax=Thalassotalea agarivorans TaxID=349064 RepID=A0A1I0DYS6_THASX|nr:calcium/sodium antiporter [Thalassotalea agarivorans]SET37443.1 cation:H+ antiporter [Thalassotalea agarivorans]